MLHFALNACRRFFSLSVDLSFPCIYLNLCLTRTTVSDEVKNMLNAMLAKRLFKAWAIVFFSFVWGYSLQPPQAATDTFTEKVLPIFTRNCLACHGTKIQRGRLDLRNQSAILRGGSRGPVIIAGNAEKSLLYQFITHKQEPGMPLGMDKLPEAEIAIIADWINQLAPSPAASTTEGTAIRPQGTPITDKDKQFWSFRKLAVSKPPAVKNRAWVRNPIDAFVLEKLEANGLTPAPPAAPRVLLRRAYLDLTGLPPSPEAVEAFAKNPSEAAYQGVIEKLLTSPHYGERWGRHWLDLARYADSGGYEFDVDRPNAWRYRDYVIKAFNDDEPYDQFIREQLANDQLHPDSTEALIPTGFCRNGPTVDNASNEETRMDELDDMVTTTSAVFLGLTVGCARCHDHKYDPLPQRDYYRMQAVFFPFQKADKPFATQADIEARKLRNKEIDAQAKPYWDQVVAIEKPARERLLAEKVDFHVRLTEGSTGFGKLTREEYRAETARRFAKDVQVQIEEIDALLTAEQIQAREKLRNEIAKIDRQRPQPLPAVMGITDKKDPGKAYLLKRGDWRTKGEEVQPGFPAILAGGADIAPANRRRQLAEWIASRENPLTPRVAVNRIWQYHFGKGIVKTPSDFGATGDRPSHPELLDWLAGEFLKRGWSWKAMHRLILTSNTYRQASRFDQVAAAKDTDNRLLWRMNPHRLEAELLRDSILTVSGKLNPAMGGPGIYPRISPDIINTGSRPRWPLDAKDNSETWRRSIYIYVKRSVLVPLMEVFDCPVTTVSQPVRAVSTVSPQALALMNNDFVLQQAGYFAERIKREAGVEANGQITRAFKIALNRLPTADEVRWSQQFIQSQTAGYKDRGDEKAQESAMRDFCHAIINLNEFLYVD
jgi:mono/diheme cytochrome c family protein